jgi:hypothetical protein
MLPHHTLLLSPYQILIERVQRRSPIPTEIYHEIPSLVLASSRPPTMLLLVLHHSLQAFAFRPVPAELAVQLNSLGSAPRSNLDPALRRNHKSILDQTISVPN